MRVSGYYARFSLANYSDDQTMVAYWIILWIVMLAAFGVAWLFIVKGCEMLDDRTRVELQDETSSIPQQNDTSSS